MAWKGFEDLTVAEIELRNARIYNRGAQVHPPTTKPSKFHNVRCEVNGERFDSKREAAEWLILKARESMGEISDLRRQVSFALHCPIGSTGMSAEVAHYVADFVWRDQDGHQHVADVKGGKATQTRLFSLKAKWMNLEHGIVIEIL